MNRPRETKQNSRSANKGPAHSAICAVLLRSSSRPRGVLRCFGNYRLVKVTTWEQTVQAVIAGYCWLFLPPGHDQEAILAGYIIAAY